MDQIAGPGMAAPIADRYRWRRILASRSTSRHLGALLLLLALSLGLFLPGMALLPLTDRDEALFVQASRQMVESGDWLDIRFQDEPRYKKPVGIYWLQGAAAVVFGGGAAAPLSVYRLPSLLGALLTVAFTYGIGTCLAGRKAGLIAALLAATTVELAFEARIGKTDAMLCATVAASQFALAWAFKDPQRGHHLGRNALFWLSLGLGTLIKGPVAPLIAGFTLAGLTWFDGSFRLLRSLQPLKGAAAFLLVVLPWLLAIGWISGGAFFAESLGHDMLSKVATGQESHGAPPGTYLLVANASFWPLSAFLPLAAVFAYRNWRDASVRFLLAWILPFWLLCEIVATKLPNYILPAMPALAVLAGMALVRLGLKTETLWLRLCYLSPAIGALVLGIGLNMLFAWAQGAADRQGMILAVILAAAGIGASLGLMRGRLAAGLALLVASAIIAYILGYALLLPRADNLFLSDKLAKAAAQWSPCANPEKIVIGYREPSLVFRLGTSLGRVDATEGAQRFRTANCAFAAVSADEKQAFEAALGPDAVKPIANVAARNLNGMKLRDMAIFVKP